MKKLFITIISMLLPILASAQELCMFNENNEMGLDSENGTALFAGTVIGETESIVATIGADDTYKPQSATFTVNDTEITGGLQGGTNPRDADGGMPSNTLVQPASGSFLVFETEADGFLFVMLKAQSNKPYTVFEDGIAIGYTFAAIGDAATDLGTVYQFTLEDNQNVIMNPVEWAEQEFLKITAPDNYAARWSKDEEGADVWDPIKVNGLGVIKFHVYAGCKYIVNSNGSKITAAGFVFSPTDNVTIKSDDITIYSGDGSSFVDEAEKWTIVGDADLVGADWDLSHKSNNMRTTDLVNYKLLKRNVFLKKGLYMYKVAKDYAMTESYPNSNATLLVGEDATYTVTFTFNAETKELTATLKKTDGIYYNYITKGKIAEVIQKPYGNYTGVIEIPEKVTHEGVEYTVKKINDYAFSRCRGLTSITIPNSVTSIGSWAFEVCSGLTSITIPNSVTSLGNSAFEGCSGLTSVTIPNSVTSIGGSAFGGCSSLTSVTIPNSVTSIGEGAFGGCSSLTSVTIPNSVTSIGNNAFQYCSALTSVTIPNSVTSIGDVAFSYCSGLTSVTIPNSVTSIGDGAFSYCSGLTSITIPNSVTSIGGYAFSGCSGLTSVTIPNSVTSIGSYAFSGCSGLTSLTIGSGVRNIYDNAFANCTKLEDVYCLAEVLYSNENWNGLQTSNNAFDGSYIDYATLHVPASAINAYKTTAPWSGFGEFVTTSGEELPKCATPTISYEEGKIKFSCETEGVEYVSELSTDDAGSNYTNEINITGKITVKVYATKSGFVNSDTATAEFTATGIFGDLNNDGKVNVADHVELTKIILNQQE